MASSSPHKGFGVDVCRVFGELQQAEPDLATAIVAIRTLMQVLEKCRACTMQELVEKLRGATDEIKRGVDCSSISVVSGGDLFLRFITLASEELEKEHNFENVRGIMLQRGQQFLNRLAKARPKIAKLSLDLISEKAKILVHSYSKCIVEVFKLAAEKNLTNQITVYITESSLDNSGHKMKAALAKLDIPSTIVLDAAIAYIVPQVDCILMGAEGVVESGGIVNKVGSYTLGLCAKALNKPTFVMAESFKFVRLYPLNQQDLPNQFKFHASTLSDPSKDLSEEHPLVDYTPPSLLTLMITDLGVLPPSAVSDELIKLYL